MFVLTPFGELKDGNLLRPDRDDYYHVETFFRDSFDELVGGGKASRIETAILRCPGGWGFTYVQRLRYLLYVVPCALLGRGLFVQEPLQILYAIHNPACPETNFVRSDGRRLR
jgi:hypothetical protein